MTLPQSPDNWLSFDFDNTSVIINPHITCLQSKNNNLIVAVNFKLLLNIYRNLLNSNTQYFYPQHHRITYMNSYLLFAPVSSLQLS